MKKALRYISVFCLIFVFLANTAAAQSTAKSAKPPLTLKLDGKVVSSSYATLSKTDGNYVSLRTVGEWLNYTVTWDLKTKTLQLKNSKETIKVTGDKKELYINGKKYLNDKAAAYANNKIYVADSFIEKYLGCTASYDKNKNQITIAKKANSSSSAGSNQENKSVTVLGKGLNDKLIVKSDTVYLPMRAVGEALGYKVEYNSKTRIMTLANNRTIKITMDKTDASVDGKAVKLDKAPFLSNGKAYVPMTFIQKNFEHDVKYDNKKLMVAINRKVSAPVIPPAENNTEASEPVKILDIAYDSNIGFPQLNIIADKAVSYSSFTLSNPDRMIIDIKNALTETGFEEKEINQGDILKVRVGQFSMEPNVVRVVVDLKSQYNCKLVQSEDKKVVSMLYGNIIQPVAYSKENNYDLFTIKGANKIESNAAEIDSPQRLVLDIDNAILENPQQVIDSISPYVKTVRTGQYEIGTARIVFELMPGAYYDIKTENNTAKIYISNMPFSIIDYKKGYNNAVVNLNCGKDIKPEVTYDEANSIIKAVVKKNLEVDVKKYEVNDNVVQFFEIAKEQIDGIDSTIIYFKLKDNIKYDIAANGDSTLRMSFQKNIQKPQDITIVIDPGHGGKDPGAVAKDGTREKDLNLDVAKRVNEKLTALGFNTIMTRTEDVYVSLQDRAAKANQNFADFYLSIHFNAFNEKTQGIETLYYPNTPSDTYKINNRDVASIFHEEVLNSVKRTSRGMTQRPGLYVLNKTKMPAILSELGFITNPSELAQIKTSAYKENSAKALTASIVRYFNEIENASLDIDIADIYSSNNLAKND